MKWALRICIVLALCVQVFGFSLVGPFAPWMTPDKGFAVDRDVGGPMAIGEGYRWNIPIVTYGYDASFMNFFGERGIAAAEDAVRMLNNVPDSDLSLLPTNTVRLSITAQSLGLYDVRSAILSALLQQMGLGPALQDIFVLRDVSISQGATNFLVVQRNFDPVSYNPSDFLNGVRFTYDTHAFPDGSFDAVELPVNQSQIVARGVAGTFFNIGEFATGLTRDDVGGLRYLYAANAIRNETLLPGLQRTDGELVNTALRPGRGKIKFQRQFWNFLTQSFDPVVQQFDDMYLENSVVRTQRLERVLATPDIVFSAVDPAVGAGGEPILITKTSAFGWINNSSGDGPGIIAPPVVISFARTVDQWATFDATGDYYSFGISGDRSLPKLEVANKNSDTVTLKLTGIRRKYTITGSSDLAAWSNLMTISNTTTSTFQIPTPADTQTFYRATEGAPF